MHLIFTSTKPGHLCDLLKVYFDALKSALKVFRKDADFTFEALKQEFRGRVSYGLLVSFLMFTVVTVKTGEEEVYMPLNKEELNRESVILKMYEKLNLDYHQRTRDLVSALCDLEFI